MFKLLANLTVRRGWLHERIGLSENPQTEYAPVKLGSPNRTMLGIRASGRPFDSDTSNIYAKEER